MRRCWGVEFTEPAGGAGAAVDPALGRADRYMLWMVRRLVLCAGDPEIAQRSLRRRLGEDDGRECYLALRLILYTICLFGRRPVRLAPPASVETTRDEALILQVLAAAQHGPDELLKASLLWLLDSKAPIDPEGPVRRLASLLRRGGVVLEAPDPSATRPDANAPAGRML